MNSGQNAKSAQQVATLKALSQQAASHLLGMTARGLRDRTDCPRNDNGTYDAAAIADWNRKRMPHPRLSDDELEQMRRIHDEMFEIFNDDQSGPIIAKFLISLKERFGDAGLAMFASRLLDEVDLWVTDHIDEPWTDERIDEWVAKDRKQFVKNLARRSLRLATVCKFCEKLRRGDKWVKADPEDDEVVQHFSCPSCIEKGKSV